MSLTKRDSIDGCGTPEEEFWRYYSEWSDDLPPVTEEDVCLMAEREEHFTDANNQ